MRIVMLSCNTGEGHNSAAKAIADVLKSKGVECDLVDVLSCLSPKFSKFVCNWHARLYKYAPKLWDVGYRISEKKEAHSDDITMLYELLSLGSSNLAKILDNGSYDAAICVHVFSGMMMTELRKTRNVDLPCYFVATDYTCSPYTEQFDGDGLFIPAPELIPEYVGCGLPQEKLIPSGIPVRQEFYSHISKRAAREILQLPEDGLVILLMCGSMGCGPMGRMAQLLTENLHDGSTVVAFCAKNQKLYDSLSDLGSPGLRVLGYTDQVSAYMDAADIAVIKPGGLSSTEAANKRLPMVFINAVGGCESRNFDFFLNRGYAIGSTNPEKVLELTLQLAGDPRKRADMEAAMEAGFSRNSAVLIAETVIDAGIRYRDSQRQIYQER